MSLSRPCRLPAWAQCLRTALLWVVATAGSAAAQRAFPPSPLVPPIEVTATRAPLTADDVLADVTVIERDEILRAGAGGLAALLQRQPGVEIIRNGGPAAVSGLFLRGTNRGQTIVLIDGVRVGSASTGAATLEAIPLEDVERIEILRGPASGLYGADAIGGVVQVFTRHAHGATGTGVRAGYGTYDTRELGASVTAVGGPVRFAIAAAHRASAGFNAVSDPTDFTYHPDRDGYSGDSASASLGGSWQPGQDVDLAWFRSRLNAQYDGGPGHDDRTVTVVETAQIRSRNRLGERWLSRLMVAQSTDDSVSLTGFGDFPFRTRMRQYAWLNDFTLPAGTLTLGAERREERVTSDAGFAVDARDTDAALALYQWRGGAHAFQANVRHDHAREFGGRTTGGVRYAYQWSPAWQASLAASTAFKAPSFNDLYFPGFSNPSLAPETARNVEAGLTHRGAGLLAGATAAWELRAVAYRNRVRDLIVLECDAAFACTPRNVDRAVLSGLTLALDASRGGTALTASLDLQDPRDERTDHLLPRRARRHGSLRVLQRIGPATLGAELVASGHRYDDADNLNRLAGYGIVNLTAEWTLARGWSVLVRGDNVLDRDYALAAHYATGGAMMFAALRWRTP